MLRFDLEPPILLTFTLAATINQKKKKSRISFAGITVLKEKKLIYKEGKPHLMN
jgi:hypothetical protein